MKNLTIWFAIGALTLAGSSASERKSIWTSFLTKESPAGCRVDSCPPSCKNSLDENYGGYIFAYGGGAFGGDFNENVVARIGYGTDHGFIIGGGSGYRTCFLGGSRFEVEQVYSELPMGRGSNGVQYTGDLDFDGTFLNFLKEIPVCGFTGYIGGGIGYASVEANIAPVGGPVIPANSDSAIAYQAIAGLEHCLRGSLNVFVQYKFIVVGETASQFGEISDFETHNAVAGLRWAF